jgi:isoquinoline 1-oxidoreductase
MNREPIAELVLEPERYELRADPVYRFEVDRREFFKTLGCGVVVFLMADSVSAQESGGGGRGGNRGRSRPSEISAWLHIGEDGIVTVFTGKTEVGQNIRTSLTQAVAEELGTPMGSIRLIMADTALTPYDMGTFGSRTTPDMAAQLHKVAAEAREALIDLGATTFKTERANVTISDGKVFHTGTPESVSFGEITKGQQLVRSTSDRAVATKPSEWKICGTSPKKVDGRNFVTGQHKYSSDISLPGMLQGKVLRPAALNAKLVSADTKEAEAISGVIVARDGDFIGVAAPDAQIAAQAARAIKAEWKSEPQPGSAELFEHLRKTAEPARQRGGEATTKTESKDDAPPAADQKLQASYTIAYIAHAPLEPRAAVAEWKDDRLTVWTGTQRPFGVRGDLAQAFGIAEDRVHVIVPDTGSGYGGKHTGEAAIEAARIAKAANKPVKLVWTREEEFTWAYCRPAGVIDVTSAARNDGSIAAWEFHNYNSGGSALRTPYEIGGAKSEQFHNTHSPLRQGSYRGLAATANHFAREVHMDELARAIKMDPLEFRMKNLKDSRLRAVLTAAADAFGWGKSKPAADRGFGIAGGTEKGSYVAMCAEVSIDRKRGAVKVERVVASFECGAVVNPDHLKNQIEGSIVMGLGGALFEAIEFENGKLTNPRFSDYRVPRFSDTPRIEVVLVDRKDLASAGAGETPIVGIAPAVGNAIFDATGIRLRSMPMVPKGLKV